MSNFSVVIITFNEEIHIKKCLDACVQISNDVLVIDSFSKDKTVEICKNANVKVIEQEWLGYSAQKNFAKQFTKHDWILYLDADEILSNKAIETYKKLTFKEKNKIYTICRKDVYCGKLIWHPEWKKRLFHKDFAQWNSDIVHEDVEIIDKSDIKNIQKLEGVVFHYTIKDKEDHLKRIDLYANLSAKKMFEKCKKASFIKQYLSPVYRFVRDYFVNLGFMSGKMGLQRARLSAYETYYKYTLLKKLGNKK